MLNVISLESGAKPQCKQTHHTDEVNKRAQGNSTQRPSRGADIVVLMEASPCSLTNRAVSLLLYRLHHCHRETAAETSEFLVAQSSRIHSLRCIASWRLMTRGCHGKICYHSDDKKNKNFFSSWSRADVLCMFVKRIFNINVCEISNKKRNCLIQEIPCLQIMEQS